MMAKAIWRGDYPLKIASAGSTLVGVRHVFSKDPSRIALAGSKVLGVQMLLV